jgi:hypothetical protein
MSFNINDSSRFAKDKSVICDYYDCSIYFNQYERTPNNGGFIKIPFFTPENIVRPNGLFISDKPTVKYMSNSLMIRKKSHNIDGVNHDGELIIENKQITNGDSKLFVCFPLKTKNVKPNIIDEIINKSENRNSKEFKMTVNLNPMFNKLQKYIFYKNDNGDIVVVFTEPINVNSRFNKFQSMPMHNDKYSILQNVAGKEGFTEGFVEGINSGEMDCEPIDITTNKPYTGLPALTYLNAGNDAQNKTINLLFAMVLFVIIFFVAVFGIPPAYKNIFVDKLQDESLTYTSIFAGFYLVLAIALSCGMVVNDSSSGITGIFFLILLMISGCAIYIMRESLDISTYEFNPNESGQMYESLKYIFMEYYYHLYDDIANKRKVQYLWGYITTIVSVLLTILLYVIMSLSSKNKKNKKISPYLNYVYSLLGIFGFGYAILLVGPFVGFIAKRE